jgi:hypothetical protein
VEPWSRPRRGLSGSRLPPGRCQPRTWSVTFGPGRPPAWRKRLRVAGAGPLGARAGVTLFAALAECAGAPFTEEVMS